MPGGSGTNGYVKTPRAWGTNAAGTNSNTVNGDDVNRATINGDPSNGSTTNNAAIERPMSRWISENQRAGPWNGIGSIQSVGSTNQTVTGGSNSKDVSARATAGSSK